MLRIRQKNEKKKITRGWNNTWVQEVLGVFDDNER